jgi:hypothetical protein
MLATGIGDTIEIAEPIHRQIVRMRAVGAIALLTKSVKRLLSVGEGVRCGRENDQAQNACDQPNVSCPVHGSPNFAKG